MTYDFLCDNLIIVCSNDIKLKLIKYCVEKEQVFNIKYFTIEEFIKNLTFSYNEETIIRVMDEFKFSFEVAKNYLDNIKYLIDEDSDDKRVVVLKNIKDFCEKNNLLIINKYFNNLLNNKKIIFVGYDYINEYYKKVMDINNIKYDIVKLRNNYKKTRVINEFNSMEDEVYYIAEEICSLIDSGVPINKIYIANINDNYNYLISKIFKLYNIPFNKEKNSSLYETLVGKYFLDNLDNDVNIVIEKIKNKFNNLELVNKIIDILNKYYFIDNIVDYKDVLVSEFKNCKLDYPIYDNAINVINLKDNIISDDEYIFLVGFNLGVIPKIYKNEDYLSDEIKFSYMEKTNVLNFLEKNIWKIIIESIDNLYISYSLGYLSENLYASSLVNEMNFKVIKKDREISRYSDYANKILMCDYLDDYYKYGNINANLNDLLATYTNSYNTYDNGYKGINKFDSINALSYSSMNNYYKCAFRYYLANVLKVDIYNENFSQYIGNLFHYILEKYYSGNTDIDNLYDNYIVDNKYDFTEKEKYFIEILKNEVKFIIETIDKQNEHSSFKDFKLEKKFVINNGDDVFKGFIDKILYKDNCVVIIDYKTGSIDIDLSLVPYGLSLQLPVYLYLLKKSDIDAKIVGFYLQHIIKSKLRRIKGKHYDSLKKDSLKLQGYSLGDETYLKEFDETYRDSEVIKSMKMGNNGFYHYSKVLSENDIDKIFNVVDEKIKEAFENIKNANFKINPKVYKGKNIGCEFCKFKDICFMSDKDNVYLEDNSLFLGGDNNA